MLKAAPTPPAQAEEAAPADPVTEDDGVEIAAEGDVADAAPATTVGAEETASN